VRSGNARGAMDAAAGSPPVPASCVFSPVIDLGTLAGLHAHDHQLAAYCPRCDAWRVLPLAEMVAQGKGSLRLPLRVRCRDCGAIGRVNHRGRRDAIFDCVIEIVDEAESLPDQERQRQRRIALAMLEEVGPA